MSGTVAATESDPNEARITDEAVEQLRSRIGQLVTRPQPYIEYANPDSIRHWAQGIGDCNPLYLDRDYASRGAHGRLLAPPTILYAMDKCVGFFGGLPGVHAMFGGSEFVFHRQVGDGDHVRAVTRVGDVLEYEGAFAGRTVQQFYDLEFEEVERQEPVASLKTWVFRTERRGARERGKYEKLADASARRWDAERLEPIREAYAAERASIRGGTPRPFASVAVGDELGPTVRGPYTATMAIAFDLGWGGMYIEAHGNAWGLFERHPRLAIPNEYGIPEPPERVHWDNDMARAVGVPAVYDYGPERVSWLGTLVTNWMGDDAFLRRLRVEVRRHNLLGEAVWCRGRVSALQPDPGGQGGIVTCELEARTDLGELSAKGEADLMLPR